MQKKEKVYLSSHASTFGMKRSSCIELSTFFQCWTPHLPQALCCEALCYSSLRALPSSGDGVSRKWGEGGGMGGGGVGRTGMFWGREGGWKIPGEGKRMHFWFIPKRLERPHLNWCIGGCWFTPALLEHLELCSACDPAKIFFTSKFIYVLVCNPTHKTENGTPNWWGTTNSKPPGPIIMVGESETLSSN
jgi:hypothetical protein